MTNWQYRVSELRFRANLLQNNEKNSVCMGLARNNGLWCYEFEHSGAMNSNILLNSYDPLQGLNQATLRSMTGLRNFSVVQGFFLSWWWVYMWLEGSCSTINLCFSELLYMWYTKRHHSYDVFYTNYIPSTLVLVCSSESTIVSFKWFLWLVQNPK